MEAVVEEGEEFQGVIGGGIRDPHGLRQDQEHEEVILVAPGPGQRPPVPSLVEFPEKLTGAAEPATEVVRIWDHGSMLGEGFESAAQCRLKMLRSSSGSVVRVRASMRRILAF